MTISTGVRGGGGLYGCHVHTGPLPLPAGRVGTWRNRWTCSGAAPEQALGSVDDVGLVRPEQLHARADVEQQL